MANSPESLADTNAVHFRAPPPSPVASGRRSCVTNDEVLSDFLEHSLRVPDLILPDRVFPRQSPVQSPPKIDFQSLEPSKTELIAEIEDSIARIGCFQLVNHGIAREHIRLALDAGAGIFTLSPEEKKAVKRTPERVFGFEETHGDDEEREMNEEFVWGRDERLRLEMEGIWPLGYLNFRKKIEALFLEIEEVAERILSALQKHEITKFQFLNGTKLQGQDDYGTHSSMCYIHKHCPDIDGDQWFNSLKHEVMRMLIRGSDHSHALGFHLSDGASEFHVYSKKGWVSFHPDKDAMVITIGAIVEAWSGGQYKNVIGRPIFKGEDREHISMAFLYSPTSIINSCRSSNGSNISIGQQIIVAVLFTLIYHFLVYIYKK